MMIDLIDSEVEIIDGYHEACGEYGYVDEYSEHVQKFKITLNDGSSGWFTREQFEVM